MSARKSFLILSLITLISSICRAAEAKSDYIRAEHFDNNRVSFSDNINSGNFCGIDGREVNNTSIIVSNIPRMNYHSSPENGIKFIDFESFSDRQNINGLNLGGVTLTSINFNVEIYANNRSGAWYHSPAKSIGSPLNCFISVPMVGVFDRPQTYIGLWGGDAGEDIDSWELEAFDAPSCGNSIGIAMSGDWNGYPYRKLEISAPNIWRFEMRWTGSGAGVCYDDLEFFSLLQKSDDVNDGEYVRPGDEITYTICYNYPDILMMELYSFCQTYLYESGQSQFNPEYNYDDNGMVNLKDFAYFVNENNDVYISNANIIDHLPEEVNYISSDPYGLYDPCSRTITWTIGTISPGDANCFTLTVKVNTKVEPCSIRNCCEIRSDEAVVAYACEDTAAAKNCEDVYKCGLNLPCDFSGDCYINFKDYAIWALDWWRCLGFDCPGGDNCDESCETPWLDLEYVCKSHYNVINIDLNGRPNDPSYSGTAAFAEAVDTNCVIGEWNRYYQGEGVLMPSPRSEDIGEPCNPGIYARAVFIADPYTHDYISGGSGHLLGDGFVKSGGPADPNPGLFIWGTMAYGGIYDVYVLASAAGSFTITDSNGTTQNKTLDGGNAPPWVEGENFVVFRDVWIDTPASRGASGPDPNYAVEQKYLTDPNCVVLTYSNEINGIQFASVKRRQMARRGVPPNDPDFDSVGNTAAYWSAATPIYIGTTGKKQNVFAGDYDAAYEKNTQDGESDYDGPDADWDDGTVHNIDYGEIWDYDVNIDDISDGRYRVRFCVRCPYGPADFSIYTDNSTELGNMIVALKDGVDPNLYYWSTDGTNVNVSGTLMTGYLYPNFFKGLHRFKIKANQACFKLKGFQFHHMYSEAAFDMDTCEDVIAYGFGLASDLNGDCYVNFADLKLFLEDWLNCNNPEDPNCVMEEP